MSGEQQTSMTQRALVPHLPDAEQEFAHTMRGSDFARFRETVRSVRGCARPVWLAGSWSAQGSDGTAVSEYSGQIAVSCNNRRASVCETCAARYAGDAYQLVKSGLSGGKGVPEQATQHRRLFVTLTAPSFGHVHSRPTSPRGQRRRCSCGELHPEDDPRLGIALDPQYYDYTGAVLWNAHAGALWHRFRITLARFVAAVLRIKTADIPKTFRLSYAKVAEYQRRGLIHFHIVIRLDGPGGPGDPAPERVDEETLAEFVHVAARQSSVAVEATDQHPAYTVQWGKQVQVDPINPTAPEGSDGERLHERKVAGYIAKYSTKGTEATAGADTRIRSRAHIEDLEISEHHRAMMRAAWRLGHRRWAHMLGFGGHFLTKSKYYSTTFTELRQTRAEHQRAEHLASLGVDDSEDITLVNDWSFVGIGWANAAQRELADAMSQRRRYAARIEHDAHTDIDGGEHG